nr:MAG: Protein of unknown function (DUF551) [Bacteriophage sp.]
MKREDIEKVADEFANKEYEISDIDRIPLYKGFYHGANWRINSVWHDADEKPKLNKFFVFQNECNEWETDCLYQQTKWKLYVAANDLVRWAYIEDLLPNMED